jgi:hypothetical protein
MSMDEHDVARMNARLQGDGYERDIEPLENGPAVSGEATCQECDGDLFQVGTFYACQNPPCSRYAVPVNEYGNTDAEQENEDAFRGERQAVSDMENGYDVKGVFGRPAGES